MGFSFKSFTAETLTSSDLNAQLTKIENKLGNIKTNDIASDAGILSKQLADRYAVAYQTCIFNGDIWGGNFSFEDQATQGSIEEARLYPEFPGKRAFLVAVSVDVRGYAQSAGGDDATVYITHNGTVINQLDFTADGVQYIRAGSGSTAYDSPIAALQTGDYIGLQLGKTADTAADNPTADVVTITLSYKVELTD